MATVNGRQYLQSRTLKAALRLLNIWLLPFILKNTRTTIRTTVITAGSLTSFWLSLSNYWNISRLKFSIVFAWGWYKGGEHRIRALSPCFLHFHCRETSLLLLLERCYGAPYCQASSTLTCHSRFPPDVIGLFPTFNTIEQTADLKLLFLIIFVVTV